MVIKCFSIILDAIAIGMYFNMGRRRTFISSSFYFNLTSILLFAVYQAVNHPFYFGISAL
jgi:hypothetical protein